ncbi:MAG TPA: hypothetical protein VFM29_10410 [Vicinamibacteria bacterium]|nr:hypothetical protein [Vicinamibacteria bacterium]
MAWSSGAAPVLLVLAGALAAGAEPTCPSLSSPSPTKHMDAFLRLAAERRVSAPPPVVLFLPGTPGSRLVRRSDGAVLFGEGRVDAGRIHLGDPRNRDVTAEVLPSYRAYGVVSEEVYRGTLRQLKEAVGDVGEVHGWGFDWRLGAGELADALQAHLAASFAGRDVVIVAHSFGGLVAWRWQETHDPWAARVEHLVILGAPFQGACETARFLLKGYRPPPDAPTDWLTRFAYKLLMGELRPASYTFPSTYQLLPAQGCLEKLTVGTGGDHAVLPLDPLSVELWKGPLGSQLVAHAWEELETTPAVFWATVERAIAEAKSTRPDPARRRVRNVRAFYSSDYATTRQVRLVVDGDDRLVRDEVVEQAGLGHDNPMVVTAPGDGRVPACEPPGCPLKDVCLDRIALTHGQLADSAQLRAYVAHVLPATVKALRVRATLRPMTAPHDLPGIDWAALRDEVAATGTDVSGLEALAQARFPGKPLSALTLGPSIP